MSDLTHVYDTLTEQLTHTLILLRECYFSFCTKKWPYGEYGNFKLILHLRYPP